MNAVDKSTKKEGYDDLASASKQLAALTEYLKEKTPTDKWNMTKNSTTASSLPDHMKEIEQEVKTWTINPANMDLIVRACEGVEAHKEMIVLFLDTSKQRDVRFCDPDTFDQLAQNFDESRVYKAVEWAKEMASSARPNVFPCILYRQDRVNLKNIYCTVFRLPFIDTTQRIHPYMDPDDRVKLLYTRFLIAMAERHVELSRREQNVELSRGEQNVGSAASPASSSFAPDPRSLCLVASTAKHVPPTSKLN